MRMGKINLGRVGSEGRKEKRSAHKPEELPSLLRIKQSYTGKNAPTVTSDFDLENEVELPGQKELVRRNVRMRELVDIVMSTDMLREVVDVRRSVIEDIEDDGRLLLAQTSPPVFQSHVGKLIEVTFLSKYWGPRGSAWLRLGYHTPLLAVLRDFRLGPDTVIDVLRVDPPKKLKASTARMSTRLEPTEDMDLAMYLYPGDTKVEILDLSVGGAKFKHPTWMDFRPGSTIEMTLRSGENNIYLSGRVVRTDVQNILNSHTAVHFDPDEQKRAVMTLSRLITEMYRHLLGLRAAKDKKRK